jgi:hypothetical protein
VATNPGGFAASIPFQILGDGLLPGSVNALAKDAVFDVPPAPVQEIDIEGGVIMTRLDIWVAPAATVGEVNSALTQIGAQIASMSPGFLAMTIAVPRQANVEGLQALVATLEPAPGIEYAGLALANPTDELPSTNVSSLDPQLLPTRFPAAWNARNLIVNSSEQCRVSRVKVLVGDHFRRPPPSITDVGADVRTFESEIPRFLLSPALESVESTHGYDVTLMLGAQFNPDARTGANPFSDCLDITGVQLGGLSSAQEIDRLARNFPSGKFILNYSKGSEYRCQDPAVPPAQGMVSVPCEPRHFGTRIPKAIGRAREALLWKERTFALWDNFVVTAGASNGRSHEPAEIYPVLATARFSSYLNTAKSPDPFLGFAADTSLWQATPEQTVAGFTSLAATNQEAFVLRETILARGLDAVGGAPNVLTVGSTNAGSTFADLLPSSFSNSGPDVSAVGEGLLKHDGTAMQGTSFTAPQVAGLASYLWLLSPALRAEAASVTRRAILENARTTPVGAAVDAYATVLSLDAASSPSASTAPVRLAILDLDTDGTFDEDDVIAFRAAYVDPNTGGQVEPTSPDYSRHDLNGDGFTGGGRTERFDLDRVGSTRFGASVYSSLAGGFSESSVTDVDILCFYAFSPMYEGSVDVRNQLLQGLCPITVTVAPASVTVAPGATQQFAATVTGTADPRVTWSATGGTISATGLFTAGTVTGSFTVRAISVINPNAFGQSTVTVASGVQASGFIAVGGSSAPAGHIRAALPAIGFDLTRPLSEMDAVLSELTRQLSSVALGQFNILIAEPITLTYSVGNLGGLNISGACGSTLDITAGNATRDPSPGVFGAGLIEVSICQSNLRLRVGEVEQVFITAQSSTIDASVTSTGRLVVGNVFGAETHASTIGINVGQYRRVASVVGDATINQAQTSTVTLTGGPPLGLLIQLSTDLVVNAGDVAGHLTIFQNTLSQGLSAIRVGNVTRNLSITSNRGFDDAEARAFAEARQVGGTITISGNVR